MIDMEEFYYFAGGRIRELRERQGLTREKLAEKANISAKFLYEVETGQKGFSANTLFNISKALAVKCDYIINDSKNMEETTVYDTIEHFATNEIIIIDNMLKLTLKLLEK